MLTKSIFLASSSELKQDRDEFEVFINRKNKDWVSKGLFLKLVLWEDFVDAISKTRLQDEYNKAIRESDLFVMLFFTKVGRYTAEEFETAFGQFKASNKPLIFTYFKDAEVSTGSANQQDLTSLWAFKQKLDALGHFPTVYKNIDELKLHFDQQLDKLVASGLIEFSDASNRVVKCDIPEITPKRPEDTAELVLSVGGVVVGGRARVKTANKRCNSSGYCYRHDYEMKVSVRNLGNERLSGYHVDVDFPAPPLECPEEHPAYVRDRSTQTRKFFRASGTCAPEVFPGDKRELLTLPYYIDDKLLYSSNLYDQPVRVELYRTGLPAVVVERLFKDFSDF